MYTINPTAALIFTVRGSTPKDTSTSMNKMAHKNEECLVNIMHILESLCKVFDRL